MATNIVDELQKVLENNPVKEDDGSSYIVLAHHEGEGIGAVAGNTDILVLMLLSLFEQEMSLLDYTMQVLEAKIS